VLILSLSPILNQLSKGLQWPECWPSELLCYAGIQMLPILLLATELRRVRHPHHFHRDPPPPHRLPLCSRPLPCPALFETKSVKSA
jgi:hypothetical protein